MSPDWKSHTHTIFPVLGYFPLLFLETRTFLVLNAYVLNDWLNTPQYFPFPTEVKLSRALFIAFPDFLPQPISLPMNNFWFSQAHGKSVSSEARGTAGHTPALQS